jgi:hypothetical protein
LRWPHPFFQARTPRDMPRRRVRVRTKARVELWMAVFEGGSEPRREVFGVGEGEGEPLVMYVGVGVAFESMEGMVVMLEVGVGVLPLVL